MAKPWGRSSRSRKVSVPPVRGASPRVGEAAINPKTRAISGSRHTIRYVRTASCDGGRLALSKIAGHPDPLLARRLAEGVVVAARLLAIGEGELGNRVVQRLAPPGIARDHGGIAGFCVSQGQGPTAQAGALDEVLDGHRARRVVRSALHVAELPDVEVESVLRAPAEEDVRRSLDQALAHDHALVLMGEGRASGVGGEDGGLGLLDLKEERILVVVAREEGDPAASAHAPYPHDLPRHVGDLVAGEERLAI